MPQEKPPALAEAPEFLRVEEAAAVLRVSRSTVYEAVRRGMIPAVDFGRKLRIPRRALERMAGLNRDGKEAN
ncbi:MAG: helix-turn-helix domain-containing protein [Thermaerobacter sp.]|jgi:excisionase family DNA binding protein|nr:helix-turn-helix domain-containing protein [Thermaerobacter sp.]